MFFRPVDQIFKRLGVASESNLAERSHWQQSTQGIESLVFEYAFLLIEVRLQPSLQWIEQLNISVKQMIHGRGVFAKQAAAFQIRARHVIQITSTDLGTEVHVASRFLDWFESHPLILDRFQRDLR